MVSLNNKRWLLIVFLLFIPFSFSKEFSLDPCAGETVITEDSTNIYLESTCFYITFPKDYNSDIDFYDKYNDDVFDLKLMSLIDANSANLNQKQTVPFASLALTAFSESDSVGYASSDNSLIVSYHVVNGQVKANLIMNDWTSNWDSGNLIMRTRVHKEDTASSHFINLPTIVDDITQPLIVEELIEGQNKFYEQTLFIGKSFNTLILDPFYIVDYSPDPAIILVNGVSETYADSEFEYNENVTTIVSDSNPLTQITTQPEHILYQAKTRNISTQSTTTLDTYQTKLNYTFNIDHEGSYLILGTAEATLNKIDRLIYTRMSLDKAGISTQAWIPRTTDITRNYAQFMTHTVKNLTSGSHNLVMQYRSERAGDISYIKNVRFHVIEIDNYHTFYDNTSRNPDTSFQVLGSLIFTPSETDNYFVIATGEYMIDDKDTTAYVEYMIDGVAIDDLNYEPMRDDHNSYRPYLFFSRESFDTTTHNITIRGREQSSTTSDFRNLRITAFTLTNSTYIDDDNEYFTNSISYRNASGINTSVSTQTEYIFMSYAQISNTLTTDSVAVAFYLNNSKICEHIYNPKQVGSPEDDMPFFCHVIRNVTGTTPSTIRYKSVTGTGSSGITNTRIVAFPVNDLIEENKERAFKGEWAEIYNSSYDWYLVLNKTISGATNLTVQAYDDDDNISTTNISITASSIGAYLINVSSLMDYELNTVGLNYTAFRYHTSNEQNWSEVRLLQITEDNVSPSVTNCNLNDTTPYCDQSVLLSCIVSDDIAMGDVLYQINGSNISTSANVNNWSSVYNLTGEAVSVLYDWEYVYATDYVGNLNQTDPALSFTYDCCYEDWQPQYGSCLINDSQLKTYTDANSCGTYGDLPVDNGTYVFCNYCSADLNQTAFSDCYFYDVNTTVRNFTWVDLNYGSCCVVTGLATDCIVNFSPYNVTGNETCHLLTQEFEIDIDTELYFDFGIGGLKSDKVYGKYYLNGTNHNATYKCISFVETETNFVVQTNPPYTKRSEGIGLLQREIEDREYFTSQNAIGAVYWTSDGLVIDGRNYIFGIDCSGNDGNRLISEVVASVNYEPVNEPLTRFFWGIQNLRNIVLGLILMIIIVFAIAWGYKTVVKSR